MRKMLLAASALGAATLGLVASGPADAQTPLIGPVACDRACLQGMVDAYLDAVVAHDARRLPLAADIRYTEDGQALAIGDGLWATLGDYAGEGAAAGYRVMLADPATGEAAFLGAIREESTPGMLALRIRAANGRITEIEAVAIRHEEMGERGGTVALFQPRLMAEFDPAAFEAPASAFLAPGEGGTRAAITAAAKGWLKAVETDDSAAAPLAADCVRRDNGTLATGNADAKPLDTAQPGYRPFALGCAEQVDSGYFKRIAAVREARHLVDEAQGLALSLAVLDSPGRISAIDVPGVGAVALRGLAASGPGAEINSAPDESQLFGARLQPNVRVPTSELMIQLTQVRGGEIVRIETLARGGPFGLSTGWIG